MIDVDEDEEAESRRPSRNASVIDIDEDEKTTSGEDEPGKNDKDELGEKICLDIKQRFTHNSPQQR